MKNLGHKNLWIKRDDLSSALYGGNKVRKLEFTLAHAKNKRKARVVTIGGIGTNHGLATAVYCDKLNLKCSLLLFKQPVTTNVKENLLLFHSHNADMIYAGSPVMAAAQFYLIQRIKKPGAYFLYAGGSSPRGTLGFVNAALELKDQIHRGLMPMPKYIFCPLGSNGTMAGLSLGFLLAGMDIKVIGISVIPSKFGPLHLATSGKVKALMEKTYHLIKKNAKNTPGIKIPHPIVMDNYKGKGYGYPTKECVSAIDVLKKREGIRLEPSYTGKTCAALLDAIKKPEFAQQVILYWHTYNSSAITEKIRSKDHGELPGIFHQFFNSGEASD